MDHYEVAISNAIHEIEVCKEKLIDIIFDITISGELKDWAENVEVGEDFYFSKELYESLDDQNIKHLLSIINHLEMRFPK